MAKLRIEWDAGYREYELDPQEYEEYLKEGDNDPAFYFDPIVSEVDIDIFVKVEE